MLLNTPNMGTIIIYTPILSIHHRSFIIREIKKILYAEDDEDIRIIVKIVLESKNTSLSLDFANNGPELLAKLRYTTPDLILLDVIMPQMDGPTVLKELRKNPKLKDIPVIFLTSKVQPHEIGELEALDVLGIIQKPFDTMNLYSTIKEMWDKHFNAIEQTN